MADKVTWRPTDDMAEWLEGRAERSMTPGSIAARTRIEMVLWRATLAAELARQTWTLPTIGLVADACNGTIWPDAVGGSFGLVAGNVGDALDEAPGSYGEKWGVDENDLMVRLFGLCPAGDLALMDALARWWSDPESRHSITGWAKVGIRIDPGQPREPGHG